jgi:transcriptional regulator with XRE-family HTH domain
MIERYMDEQSLADAKRLKKLWIEKKDELHLSQVKAAKEFGYNSQGAVSQYLNGKAALNMSAVAKFAQLLKVNVADISPRFGSMVANQKPTPLDSYSAPTLGTLNGKAAEICLDWFAYSSNFLRSINSDPQHIKTVRLDDDSFKEYPSGTVLMVDDSHQSSPKDGAYLMEMNGGIVARRIHVVSDVITIAGGKKEIKVTTDTFEMLRILAKVLLVLTPA